MRRLLAGLLALVIGTGAAQARAVAVGEFNERCFVFAGASGQGADLPIFEKIAEANDRFCMKATLDAARSAPECKVTNPESLRQAMAHLTARESPKIPLRAVFKRCAAELEGCQQ